MRLRNFLIVFVALSLVTGALTIAIPRVAADSISVTADQPVHALGDQVTMAVSYVGGVHGDVKLSMEDSSGSVVKQWSWSHASSDAFQQTVSYTPLNAGNFVIKAFHQPHHMEARVSASAEVAVWSARILNLEYANIVDAGKSVEVKATVIYYFTQPTQVKLDLWSDLENKTVGTVTQSMNGQGTATLALSNVVFSTTQTQDVTARISYQSPSGSWVGDVTGGSYNGQVTVVP